MTNLNYDNLTEEQQDQLVLTAQEEAKLILADLFGDDIEAEDAALHALCEEHGIAFDWEINADEIYDLIIENEDALEDGILNNIEEVDEEEEDVIDEEEVDEE